MAIKTTSILTAGTNNHQTTSQEANQLGTDFVSRGILGAVSNTNGVAPSTGGYAVNAQGTPAMSVVVSAGVLYTPVTPTGQASQMLRSSMNTTETVTISNNATGVTKYDFIYLSHSAANANNPDVSATNVATLVVSRASNAVTDDGTPPSFGELLAVVTVVNGAASITNGSIRDRRATSSIGTLNTTSDWRSLSSYPVALGVNNGQKEFTVVYSGVDLTGKIPIGSRHKVDRLSGGGTQVADFESTSSQYASRVTASVTGITFTDDFTVEAWIKLESYTNINGEILSRGDATTGWGFRLTSTLQPEIYGRNANNGKICTAQQSIPLGVKTHIAASLDMSGSVGAIYVNGVLIPSTTGNLGSGASALAQTGDLTMGRDSGTSYYDGELSEVRLWNAVRTQTQIRTNMTQQLVGNETNLISYYKLDGNFNDTTANGNNLTASGGAVATVTDHPFNSTEYGIVTDISYSTPNTTVTVFTGSDYSIPNTTLQNPAYSTVKDPFGFPTSPRKWQLQTLFNSVSSVVTTGSISLVWGPFVGSDFLIPKGSWRQRSRLYITGYCSTASAFGLQTQWDTASPIYNKENQDIYRNPVSSNYGSGIHRHIDTIDVSTPTTYILYGVITGGSGTQIAYIESSGTYNLFTIENGYL